MMKGKGQLKIKHGGNGYICEQRAYEGNVAWNLSKKQCFHVLLIRLSTEGVRGASNSNTATVLSAWSFLFVCFVVHQTWLLLMCAQDSPSPIRCALWLLAMITDCFVHANHSIVIQVCHWRWCLLQNVDAHKAKYLAANMNTLCQNLKLNGEILMSSGFLSLFTCCWLKFFRSSLITWCSLIVLLAFDLFPEQAGLLKTVVGWHRVVSFSFSHFLAHLTLISFKCFFSFLSCGRLQWAAGVLRFSRDPVCFWQLKS